MMKQIQSQIKDEFMEQMEQMKAQMQMEGNAVKEDMSNLKQQSELLMAEKMKAEQEINALKMQL